MFGLLGMINKAGNGEMKVAGTIIGGTMQGEKIGGYITNQKGGDTSKLYMHLDGVWKEFPYQYVKSYTVTQPGQGLRCAIYEIEWMSGKKSLIEFSGPGENKFVRGYSIYQVNKY